jgi:sortase B
LKKTIIIVLIAVCALIFGISAYQLISYYSVDSESESTFAHLLPDEMAGPDVTTEDGGAFTFEALLPYYEKLREQNGDMVGWLRIPGTRVSYPVMQTPNSPEYYLDRNFNKEYSVAGTLFASDISDVNLPSDVITIYGHRMRTGAMFGSLGEFLKQDFFEKYQTIIFDTFSGRNEYRIYGVLVEAVNVEGEFAYYYYSNFADEAMFNGFMSGVRQFIKIERPAAMPEFGDKILLLSTCEYTHEDGRLILIAVRV